MRLPEHAKYDSYKDSGIDWIGYVPSHWNVNRNASLFIETKRPGHAGLPVLSVSIHKGVSNEELSEVENIRSAIKIEDRTSYKEVCAGDITYNMMRAWQGGIGAVPVRGMVSPAYVVAKPIGEIDADFFELLYRTPTFIQQMDRFSKGITDFRKRLYWDEFRALLTLVPPLHEQKQIVRNLRRTVSKIDQAIRIKEEQIELLKERKQILIQTAVTKGIDPDAPMKDSGFDWIGEIPAHWEVVPILGVAEVIDPNPSHRNPEYVDEGFPFISTQEFRGDEKIELETPRKVSEKTIKEQESRCRFSHGSLVFSRKGTIGAVRVLPADVRLGILDSLCVINPKKNVLPSFLFWTLTADYLSAQFGSILRGAALPQLSVGRVRSLKVVIPPKQEQQAISNVVDGIARRIRETVFVKEKQISKLKEYKTSLINAAVTGKIKVV